MSPNKTTFSAMINAIDACKTFDGEVVLSRLNLTVPTGKIYGLLGPSGCGKTVLLNCILGIQPLDRGHIELGVHCKSEIGYMPQELGLFEEFTIKEIFTFYGRMFGLNFEDIKNKSKGLTKILELPEWHMRVGSLSGGEQRRISLAVALIHNPKLLVLDEPTVGVDPILSKNIWDFLEQASGNGMTILVTTHYTEEARMAHVIGLMREGELIVEDSPAAVMFRQNADSLEKAFLHLTLKHQASSRCRKKVTFEDVPIGEKDPMKNTEVFNWDRFSAQLVKNYIWMKRNTTIIGLLLLLPAMQSFLFCLSFGHNPTDIKVAVIADELSPSFDLKTGTSKACMEIDTSKGYLVDGYNCSMTPPFSCHLLKLLQISTDTVVYLDSEHAKNAVVNNDVWATLHIPPNFSQALTELVLRGSSVHGDEMINWALDKVEIEVQMDSSNYIINQLLRKTFLERYADFIQDLVMSCGFPENVGSLPIKFMDPVFGSRHPVYGDSGLPGFLCSFCFFFTILFTSGALMMEKMVGLLERSMVAGMTYFEIVSAHLVVQFSLAAVQKTIMLVVFYVLFDHPLLGSAALLVALLFAIEIVGIAYGFFISEVFASERLVTYATIGATLSLFSVAGIVWPTEGAHWILRNVVWALPVTPAVDSYKSITLKGYSLSNYVVLRGFISCFFWTLLLSLATAFVFRNKRTKCVL